MADGSIILTVTPDISKVKDLDKALSTALKNGDTKLAGLIQNFQKANNAVEQQTAKVQELRRQLDGLKSGDVAVENAGIKSLQKQLSEVEQEAKRVVSEMVQLRDTGLPISDSPIYKGLEDQLAELSQKSNNLKQELQEAVGEATQQKISQTTAQLIGAETKLEQLTNQADIAGTKLQQSGTKMADVTEDISKGFEKVTNRIGGLIKRVFFFSVITLGLRKLRKVFSDVAMSDEGFRQSLYRLQAALWTAFTPIISYIIPVVQRLINILTAAATAIGRFIAFLTGKSYADMANSAKALQNQADAYKDIGKSSGSAAKGMKKATDEAKKQLAAFDDLTIISENKAEADSGAGGGGGAGGIDTAAGGLNNELDTAVEKLQGIAILVGSIAASLLAWKITDFITNLIQSGDLLESLNKTFGKLAGFAMIISGAILEIKGYSDAWVNGIDWANFLQILSGAALIVAGIAIAISPQAAAFVAIGEGIALLVLAMKDFIENGPSFRNILTIIIGLGAVFAATWYLAGAPIAIIVTAIAALTTAFILLWNKSEAFRNFWIELWERLKTTATSIWENSLKPTLEKFQNQIDKLWKKIKELWENIKKQYDEKIKPHIDNLVKKLKETFGESENDENAEAIKPFKILETIVSTVIENVGNIIIGLAATLTGLISMLNDIVSGDWAQLWEDFKSTVVAIFNTLGLDEPLNKIIGGIEGFINRVIRGINKLISGLNKLGEVGEKIGLGFEISTIPEVSLGRIPKLATGAVLPPNKPFLAMVGDQKSGTNIEAPLATIVEAMNIALQGQQQTYGNIEVVLEIDGREFGRAVVEQGNRESRRIGTRLVLV